MAFPQLGFPQVYGVDRASSPRDAGSEAGVTAAANPAALAPLLGVYANPWSAHRYGAFLPYSSADAAILNHMGSQYELKESPGAHGAHAAGLAVHAAPGFYPYGQFHYADPSRAKSATRETTSTLKAWLHEHKKNPYPTKGEKIMLAIVTKMTLTQVSTWFANARRRLKKENKVTWGRSADDVDSDEYDEDGVRKGQSEREEEIDLETVDSDEEREDKPDSPKVSARSDTDGEGAEDADAQPPHALSTSTHSKPKIWSLAETATSPDSGHKATPIPTHPAFLSTSGIYTCQIGRLSAWPGGALLGVRSLMAAAAAGTSTHYVTGTPPSASPTGSLSPQHSSDRENVQSPKSPALPPRPSFPVIHSRSHHETAAQCPLKTVS